MTDENTPPAFTTRGRGRATAAADTATLAEALSELTAVVRQHLSGTPPDDAFVAAWAAEQKRQREQARAPWKGEKERHDDLRERAAKELAEKGDQAWETLRAEMVQRVSGPTAAAFSAEELVELIYLLDADPTGRYMRARALLHQGPAERIRHHNWHMAAFWPPERAEEYGKLISLCPFPLFPPGAPSYDALNASLLQEFTSVSGGAPPPPGIESRYFRQAPPRTTQQAEGRFPTNTAPQHRHRDPTSGEGGAWLIPVNPATGMADASGNAGEDQIKSLQNKVWKLEREIFRGRGRGRGRGRAHYNTPPAYQHQAQPGQPPMIAPGPAPQQRFYGAGNLTEGGLVE